MFSLKSPPNAQQAPFFVCAYMPSIWRAVACCSAVNMNKEGVESNDRKRGAISVQQVPISPSSIPPQKKKLAENMIECHKCHSQTSKKRTHKAYGTKN